MKFSGDFRVGDSTTAAKSIQLKRSANQEKKNTRQWQKAANVVCGRLWHTRIIIMYLLAGWKWQPVLTEIRPPRSFVTRILERSCTRWTSLFCIDLTMFIKARHPCDWALVLKSYKPWPPFKIVEKVPGTSTTGSRDNYRDPARRANVSETLQQLTAPNPALPKDATQAAGLAILPGSRGGEGGGRSSLTAPSCPGQGTGQL